MLSRRTVLASAIILPAAHGATRISAAETTATPTVPDAVKSHAAPYPSFGSVSRLDPALDALVPPDAKLEKLAEGFEWTEGPVWVKGKGKGAGGGGYLLFSE